MNHVGMTILANDRSLTGEVLSVCEKRRCPVEDCRGTTLCVKWVDGLITYPCTADLETAQKDGEEVLQII